MVFICRPDVLLVSLCLLAYATRVVQAGYINIGDTVALESAPKRVASGRWINGTRIKTDDDYTLTSTAKCDKCTFTLLSVPYHASDEIMNQYYVVFKYVEIYEFISYYMSCQSNGRFKGDKCRTRYCPLEHYGQPGFDDCVAEVFELFIHPGTEGLRLQDGDMVQLKNRNMDECVNNRDDLKVDMERCNDDDGTTYWKIHKVVVE